MFLKKLIISYSNGFSICIYIYIDLSYFCICVAHVYPLTSVKNYQSQALLKKHVSKHAVLDVQNQNHMKTYDEST